MSHHTGLFDVAQYTNVPEINPPIDLCCHGNETWGILNTKLAKIKET